MDGQLAAFYWMSVISGYGNTHIGFGGRGKVSFGLLGISSIIIGRRNEFRQDITL